MASVPRPEPSSREAQRAATRARLVDAAVALFAERGYQSVTIEDIGSRAHVGRTTFYLHFSDKSEVARAIGRRIGEDLGDYFLTLAELSRFDPETLIPWVEGYLKIWSGRPAWLQVAMQANVSSAALTAEGIRVDVAAVEQLIDGLRRAGHQVKDQAVSELFFMRLALQRLFFAPSAYGLGFPVEREIEVIAAHLEFALSRSVSVH